MTALSRRHFYHREFKFGRKKFHVEPRWKIRRFRLDELAVAAFFQVDRKKRNGRWRDAGYPGCLSQ